MGASVNHPNLVSIYDVITDDDLDLVIVMEYVAGETLRHALDREGRVPTEHALRIIEGTAAGLDAIHGLGIVHRDIKPANILLGTDGAVKLADLGIAAALDRTRITTTGTLLGSFGYMAPEQLEETPPTTAIDIYALAAVAYEVLSGVKARRESTPIAVAHAVATQPPPDIREVWPEAPSAVAELLTRAMAREPAERPSTAGELVAPLRAALEPQSTDPRTLPFGRPRRRPQPVTAPEGAATPQEAARPRDAATPQDAPEAPAARDGRAATAAGAAGAAGAAAGAAGAAAGAAAGLSEALDHGAEPAAGPTARPPAVPGEAATRAASAPAVPDEAAAQAASAPRPRVAWRRTRSRGRPRPRTPRRRSGAPAARLPASRTRRPRTQVPPPRTSRPRPCPASQSQPRLRPPRPASRSRPRLRPPRPATRSRPHLRPPRPASPGRCRSRPRRPERASRPQRRPLRNRPPQDRPLRARLPQRRPLQQASPTGPLRPPGLGAVQSRPAPGRAPPSAACGPSSRPHPPARTVGSRAWPWSPSRSCSSPGPSPPWCS